MASIAGSSSTDALDVVGLWVSGRSVDETIGVSGGLTSGGGQGSMAGQVTRPRTDEPGGTVISYSEYPDAVSRRITDLCLVLSGGSR